MQELKMRIIQGFVILVAVIYLAKLFYLQVIDEGYSEAAVNNAIEQVIQIPNRGQVYDRKGKLIVYNTPTYDLYITPKKAKIPDTLRLCHLLGITKVEFDSMYAVAKTYSKYKPSLFMRQLSVEDFARVQDAMVDYPGFTFETNSFRTYNTSVLANTLGYVAEVSPAQLEEQEENGESYYRQGDYIGKSGLEKYYEETLRGRRGVKYIMKDVHGVIKGAWKDGAMDVTPIVGKNLYTSIDLDLQEFADSLFQNKSGSLVAIDPSTGEILAMVSSPSYDPKLLAGRNYSKNYAKVALNPYNLLLNRALQGTYRPGSTFKTIETLVGLQQGAITPGTILGHSGIRMNCHCGRSSSDLHTAIQRSCNPYFYHVFRRIIYNNDEQDIFRKSKVGLTRWHDQVAKFGIGQKLGIDLPYEKKGLLPDVEYYNKRNKGENNWKFSNIYSVGIGEGELLVTPLKLANVAAIIANRGWYITPHIVRAIGSPNAAPLPEYTEKHSVDIDYKNFEILISGMRDAVSNGTVTPRNFLNELEICGKTGTSQNRPGQIDNSVFICFAPRVNPKIAIAAVVDFGKWGGTTAGPISMMVAEKYIKGHTTHKAMEQEMMNRYLLHLPNAPKKTPKTDSSAHKQVTKPLIVQKSKKLPVLAQK
ncbi:MAG: penicillin-binding protein 2 [Siphonobacter sp.]